ncbi:MAG: hypothetical protein HGA68_03320, partial [Methanothrix sp.]|nr:hypothetical protein [Methanothrix sp.]
RQFIQTWLLNEAGEIAADKRHTNYKSLLQEYVQSTFHTHPVYRIRQEHGPDHLKQFTVEVTVASAPPSRPTTRKRWPSVVLMIWSPPGATEPDGRRGPLGGNQKMSTVCELPLMI